MPSSITIQNERQNARQNSGERTPIIHDPSSEIDGNTACLDTVGIAYKCEAIGVVPGCTETVHHAGTDKESRRWTRKLEGGGFLSWGMGNRAWVEASVPKAATGSNVVALPVRQALDVMGELLEEAQTFVPPNVHAGGHRLETAKVVRLDLVRDFDDVDNLGYVLDSLAEQARPLRWKAARFSDAARGGSATLSVGPRAWKATLYDKAAETRGEAPEGRLRFEARMHHDQLVSVGAQSVIGRPELSVLDGLSVPDQIGNRREVLLRSGERGVQAGKPLRSALFTVADIEESKLLELRRWVFDRVGYGKEIMATDGLRLKVFRPVDPVSLRDCNGLSKREQRELWAFLTAGEQLCGFGRSARSKYRQMADDLGVVLEHVEELGGVQVTSRLDYDSGRQLLGVAA